MNPIRLSREEIKKLVYGIESLNQDQRALIRETLEALSRSSDARISPEELRKALSRLRAEYKISEIDAKAVTRAVFPS
ncbi:MAG: hypothetical protein QY323_02750 [Patescibacteria group bacterium]|nr:MAG: hypothetical protein QY323_02750 [Patescibacteria group bacterium]